MRRQAFRMVYEKQLGHPGGDFSAIDIVATLYFGVLRYDPRAARLAGPRPVRHVQGPRHRRALLRLWRAAGYFPEDLLDTYMQPTIPG